MADIGSSNVQIHPQKYWDFILGLWSIQLLSFSIIDINIVYHRLNAGLINVKVFFCFYISRKLQESIIFGLQENITFSEDMSILSRA